MIKHPIVALLSLGFVFAVTSGEAAAQNEDPLRLVYVNIADEEGADSFRTVKSMLDDSDQIDLISGEQFLDIAGKYGVDTGIFRSSEERRQHVDEFAGAMWQIKVEGILVHAVRDGVENLEITVIGPRGWELGEVELPLARGDLDEETALEVLRGVFSSLVPEVRGFRREIQEGVLDDEDFMEVPESDEVTAGFDRGMSPRDLAIAEHRRRYGNMEQNIAVRVGPVLGQRSLRMSESESGFALRHGTPLTGFGARVDGLVTTFDRDTAAIEVGGVFVMAPITTVFDDQELSGQFMRFGAEGRYISARSSALRLRAIAGVETMNISLQANQDYTGHGYLVGRFGGGIHYSMGSLMTIQIDALFLPVINASNSGGAYGESQGWLGVGTDIGVHLDLFEPILAGITLSSQYFELEYPDAQMLISTADSRDFIHQLMIGVGYRL